MVVDVMGLNPLIQTLVVALPVFPWMRGSAWMSWPCNS